jgi:hypothetical protein
MSSRELVASTSGQTGEECSHAGKKCKAAWRERAFGRFGSNASSTHLGLYQSVLAQPGVEPAKQIER